MARTWASLMGGVRYGFKPFYFITIDGVPLMPSEVATSSRSGGAPIDDAYTIDASLVVDDSSRIGPVLDERSHFAKGFDGTFRLLETPAVRDLFARPSLMTYLTADIDEATTTFPVESTRGFGTASTKPRLYYGHSCSDTGWGYLATSFTSVTRSDFGTERSYKKGTVVSDRPYKFTGRAVRLYVAMLDPLGRTVQTSASLIDDACMVWMGHIQEQPRKEGTTWVVDCRDQIRRLTEPLGLAASGQAVWTLEDDSELLVPESLTIAANITVAGSSVVDVSAVPFAGLGGTRVARSKIRQLIVDALTAAVAESDPAPLNKFVWQKIRLDTASGGTKQTWQLFANIDTEGAIATVDSVVFRVQVTGNPMAIGMKILGTGAGELFTADSAGALVPSGCYLYTEARSAGLSVVLEDGTYERLPDAGWVLLEVDSGNQLKRYTSKSQDTRDYLRVNLALDPALSSSELQWAASRELAGDGEVSVAAKFLWRDTGPISDVLRRLIVSTGDGTGGTHDTLPRGQGYGLPYIDADSFDTTFDGAFIDVSADVAVEGGTSGEKLFGGILKLSQRALVTRRAADGSSVDIVAISVGAPDGFPVATIDDDALAFMDGQKPVRPVAVYKGPQAIGVKCRTIPVGDKNAIGPAEAEIELDSDHLTTWTAERWSLDVHGISRADLVFPAYAWGQAWFRGGENRQVVELDIPPWIDVQVGDIVALDITDPTLFDYASGRSGLSGLARVIGAQFSLTTGVVTLTVQTSGVASPGPMSPSLPLSRFDGTATAPTAIYIDGDYVALIEYALGDAASLDVLCYLPGQDTGHAQYTITAVELSTGDTKLTVSAYPSSPAVTLTTAFLLTWPTEDDGTTEQNRFLHTSHRVQWS